MRLIMLLLTVCVLDGSIPVCAQTSAKEKLVRQAVQSFYNAFNAHGFGRAAEFTTCDWNHINPFGGRTRDQNTIVERVISRPQFPQSH